MASSLFIDISACGVGDVYAKRVQPGLHGQQGTVSIPRWILDGNYHSLDSQRIYALFSAYT